MTTPELIARWTITAPDAGAATRPAPGRGARGSRRVQRGDRVDPGVDTVERAVQRRFSHWSRDHIAKLLRQGRVLCNGVAAALGQPLSGGERLEITVAGERAAVYLPNRKLRLSVVHADACLAVIAKPPGLPVRPGPGHGTRTLLNGLLALFEDELRDLGEERGWGIVHRLDLPASGLLIVARSAFAFDRLRAQFAARTVSKRYLALVAGRPAWEETEVSSPVQGKDALTRMRVLERFPDCTLVEARPVTGRNHQIRWHTVSLGHPIVGDLRYGPDRPHDHPLRRLGVHRMMLHATQLTFTHPATLQPLELHLPPPRDMRRALARARRGGEAAAPPVSG